MGTQQKLAPIICALAEIRFIPLEAIDADKSIVASIQDALRKIGFPHYLHSKSLQIQESMTPGADGVLDLRIMPIELERYDFYDIERQWLITLDKGRLSVMTTGYTRWEDFSPRYSAIIEAVMPALDASALYIQRTGYRSIDLICPLPGENVEDILSGKIIGGVLDDIDVAGVDRNKARSQCHIKGEIKVNDTNYDYIIMSEVMNTNDQPAPSVLPPELIGPPPATPTVSPKQQPRAEGTFARLSIDMIYNADLKPEAFYRYDKDVLIQQIHSLKSTASNFYHHLIDRKKHDSWT